MLYSHLRNKHKLRNKPKPVLIFFSMKIRFYFIYLWLIMF